MSDLPPGWERKPLGDVAEVILGQSPPGSSYNSEADGVSFFQGKAEFGSLYPTVKKWTTAPKKYARRNDVLVSVRAPVGPTNLAPLDCSVGRGLAALRAPEGMPAKYLLYAMRASVEALASQATGTTFAAVTGKQLREHEIVVAPLDEQERIVEAIEEQFSRLDAGVESLQRAKRNLARLRASTLKEAVDGRLNGAATASGTLPDGWVMASPDDLAAPETNALAIGPFGSNLKVSDYTTSGIPLVFVRNIRRRRFDGNDTKYVTPEKAAELQSHQVEPGDLLITKMGDPPGDAAIYSGDGPAIITADCIKLRPRPGVDVRYLDIVFNSPVVRSQILGITRGVAQKKVSLGRFRNGVKVPLPPSNEQAAVVAEVERRVSVVEVMETIATVGMARAESLRRSILRDAFAGRLARSTKLREWLDA